MQRLAIEGIQAGHGGGDCYIIVIVINVSDYLLNGHCALGALLSALHEL